MYSIKLDVQDTIFDKVMFFLNNIPKTDIMIKEIKSNTAPQDSNLVDFFMKSPLRGEVEITRENQQYTDRVAF